MSFTLNSLSALGTMAAAIFAGWQLWLMRRQATTEFEDRLSDQYREIIHQLPVAALLGEDLGEAEYLVALPTFYQYIDLCNEQAFLKKRRRIRRRTWVEWREGIEQNLKQPAFKRAWAEIARRAPESFDELREISPPPLSAAANNSTLLTHQA